MNIHSFGENAEKMFSYSRIKIVKMFRVCIQMTVQIETKHSEICVHLYHQFLSYFDLIYSLGDATYARTFILFTIDTKLILTQKQNPATKNKMFSVESQLEATFRTI